MKNALCYPQMLWKIVVLALRISCYQFRRPLLVLLFGGEWESDSQFPATMTCIAVCASVPQTRKSVCQNLTKHRRACEARDDPLKCKLTVVAAEKCERCQPWKWPRFVYWHISAFSAVPTISFSVSPTAAPYERDNGAKPVLPRRVYEYGITVCVNIVLPLV